MEEYMVSHVQHGAAQRSSAPGQRPLAVIEPSAHAWDNFTQQHPYGNLLQSSAWGSLKTHFGWEQRRIAVADTHGILAGAQILLKRRMGVSVAYVPRGPLFSGDSTADQLLLSTLDRQARNQRAVFLRIEPNMLESDPGAAQLHSDLLLRGFQTADPIQPRSTIHLDLTPTPDRLLAAMSKGHRADIRRAEREHVQIRVGADDADLDAFYQVMEATSARAHFAIHSRNYYHTAWSLLRNSGHAQLLLAEYEGAVVAAFLIFKWAGSGLYLYSCATSAGLKSGANHALQWHALQWARQGQCQRYDFWGIPDALGQAAAAPNEPERLLLEQQAQSDELFGVFRFKKGFGGQVVRYLPAYDQIYIAPLYRIWQRRFGGA